MSITGHDRPLTVDEYSEWNATLLARKPVSRRSMLKGAFIGGGALALVPFPAARAAFAAGGGKQGTGNLVISGRHLSWVADHGRDATNAMRTTAQLFTPTGVVPKGLRAYVEIGSEYGRYGKRVEADIVHLVGMYAIPGGPVEASSTSRPSLTGCGPAPSITTATGSRTARPRVMPTSRRHRHGRCSAPRTLPQRPSPSPLLQTWERTWRRPTRSSPGGQTRRS